MGAPQAYQLARNSLEATFVSTAQQTAWVQQLDAHFAQYAAAH
jgi:adenine deaminase